MVIVPFDQPTKMAAFRVCESKKIVLTNNFRETGNKETAKV